MSMETITNNKKTDNESVKENVIVTILIFLFMIIAMIGYAIFHFFWKPISFFIDLVLMLRMSKKQ